MRTMIVVVFSLLIVTIGKAQTAQRGRVSVNIEGAGQPLENATVELLKGKDSSLVKAAISGKNGLTELENIPFETYLLRVTMVNFTRQYSQPFTLTASQPELSLPPVTLSANASTQMKEVTVTARKPFIQKLSDRIVVNVDNSIVNAGSSALDVLERSPGVLIDPNDIISLRGRQGVIIMIDGKITPMSGTDLANMLRSLPSNAIERIDIITNPSARHDAAGNSGIIDIRMKKDQRLGANGTFTAGYGQGVFPKANTGATFNFRNKKVNFFGSYNYAHRQNLNHLFLKREFFKNGSYDGAYDQDNYMKIPVNTNNIRLGADYLLSKKSILGFVVNSTITNVDRTNENQSLVLDAVKQPASKFITNQQESSRPRNILANINYKYTFDSTGRELTADIDYGVFNNRSRSQFNTGFYQLDGTPTQPAYKLNGDQQGKITIATAKADYVHPLNKTTRLETGFKSSFVETGNDVVFYDVSSTTPVYDSSKSNDFRYKENNNAVYVNLNSEFKKISLMAGLRAEQTNMEGHQVVNDIRFDSSYLQLFPSVFLNYKLGEDKTIGISVSRRIDRPNYSELNPFRFFLDPSTYSSGNPYLKPQLTWSYELSYTVKQLSFTLGYSHTKQNTTVVIRPSETEDKVTVQMPVNLHTYDYFGLTVAAPIRFTKWWNAINNANIYYGHYNGNLANTTLDNGTPAANISTNNTFTLAKGWTIELNASVNTGGQVGFMKLDPQWQLSPGVQKTILNKKGTLRFSVTDIFWTNLPRAVVEFTNYVEHWHAQRESRVASLSFTYRFGKNTVAAARRRTTASEEERRRAGN
ncbi:TonB-dependent receptor [Paraflavitalea sp. CAU 1676]|uniref:TonB-dependent receptor domain-containing protein n=1 Tax=Paraflavitalea sp. CAU 1676 TaxID=3032598 RepID=UPI0023DC54B3|nr:TonB-dependent receptor [Paraflavitalea sp. CAU 1676]MDF2191091.1 TonB-dependent receptor [Paraflavitalea sp. CAU 1676]